VLSVFQDSNGDMWFGTDGGGVNKFDGTTWITYTEADGLFSNHIQSISQDSNGIMWFASSPIDKGVSEFDGTTWDTHATTRWVMSIISASGL
jgi:ligand-binding sensor domain-containing protein